MPSSPAKLRGATVTNSLEQDNVGQFRSISVNDEVDDTNDIEVINAASEAEEEESRNPRREEEQPMTKEKRLAFKQMERWRVAMKKRSKRLRRSSKWNAKTQAYDDEVEFDSLFGSNSTFGRELQVVSYPWPIWIFGLLIIMGASVFVHSVHSQRDDDGLHRNADWWKYVVAVAIYVLGVVLIANGRVETFYMNKESSRLSVRSNKPLCLSARYTRVVDRDMRHITNIRVEAAGEYSGDVDTRMYKVHFDFDDGSHVTALESRSKQKTMRRCRHIKAFAADCPPAIAPLRSASEHFQPVLKVSSGSPLRHATTSPAKLIRE